MVDEKISIARWASAAILSWITVGTVNNQAAILGFAALGSVGTYLAIKNAKNMIGSLRKITNLDDQIDELTSELDMYNEEESRGMRR